MQEEKEMMELFACGECSSHDSVVQSGSEVRVRAVDTSQSQQQSLITLTNTAVRREKGRRG